MDPDMHKSHMPRFFNIRKNGWNAVPGVIGLIVPRIMTTMKNTMIKAIAPGRIIAGFHVIALVRSTIGVVPKHGPR